MNPEAKYIDHYIQDGFVKICDVDPSAVYEWQYTDIHKLMFSTHNSWVYFITLDDEVVKIGETGQPLGIEMSDGQPKKGTQCRLGRYRTGDGTDSVVRRELKEDISKGRTVSIWALKCPIYTSKQKVGGRVVQIDTTTHKSLELTYIDYFESQVGSKPLLNKGRK